MANPYNLSGAALNVIFLKIAVVRPAMPLNLFYTATTEKVISLCAKYVRHCFLRMKIDSQKHLL
jgi:hypothetical protein